jgi:hypothetical protein
VNIVSTYSNNGTAGKWIGLRLGLLQSLYLIVGAFCICVLKEVRGSLHRPACCQGRIRIVVPQRSRPPFKSIVSRGIAEHAGIC